MLSSATMSAQFVLKKLSFAYRTGESPLFEQLDVEIPAGAFFSIVGPGGAGKSTLLRLMAGLLRPTGGSIEVSGTPKVGMTFQQSGLFDWLTCGANLDFPLRESGVKSKEMRRQKIAAALAEVGLEGTEPRTITEISGGMRKRLAIARALVLEPEVLLCDDPTAGLDPVTAAAIGELLRGLWRRKGMTVIMVTSRFYEAEACSDRIGFLYGGKFAAVGSPAELRIHSHPAVYQFIRGRLEGPLTESSG
jgi:phospholipid/cholesterol/gamma-HCH transport system ATP-binding protein